MSRIKKRFERLLNNPSDIKWDELQPIFTHYNLKIINGSKGSHFIVYHDDIDDQVTVSVHNNRIKKVYLKKIINIIELVSEEESKWIKIYNFLWNRIIQFH